MEEKVCGALQKKEVDEKEAVDKSVGKRHISFGEFHSCIVLRFFFLCLLLNFLSVKALVVIEGPKDFHRPSQFE